MIDIAKVTPCEALKLLGALVVLTSTPQERDAFVPLFADLARPDKNYLWWQCICAELTVDQESVAHLQSGDYVAIQDLQLCPHRIPCVVVSVEPTTPSRVRVMLRSVHAWS